MMPARSRRSLPAPSTWDAQNESTTSTRPGPCILTAGALIAIRHDLTHTRGCATTRGTSFGALTVDPKLRAGFGNLTATSRPSRQKVLYQVHLKSRRGMEMLRPLFRSCGTSGWCKSRTHGGGSVSLDQEDSFFSAQL